MSNKIQNKKLNNMSKFSDEFKISFKIGFFFFFTFERKKIKFIEIE